MAEKNKYTLSGQFASATGSEIRLNVANIPQGSVKVKAGGATLTENVDYTVDYNLGSVKIINLPSSSLRLRCRCRLRATNFMVCRQSHFWGHT